jgi:hypothetical protein
MTRTITVIKRQEGYDVIRDGQQHTVDSIYAVAGDETPELILLDSYGCKFSTNELNFLFTIVRTPNGERTVVIHSTDGR